MVDGGWLSRRRLKLDGPLVEFRDSLANDWSFIIQFSQRTQVAFCLTLFHSARFGLNLLFEFMNQTG